MIDRGCGQPARNSANLQRLLVVKERVVLVGGRWLVAVECLLLKSMQAPLKLSHLCRVTDSRVVEKPPTRLGEIGRNVNVLNSTGLHCFPIFFRPPVIPNLPWFQILILWPGSYVVDECRCC